MAGHRNFSELRKAIPAERQAANRKAAEKELQLLLLAELRKLEQVSQAELAHRMGVSQPAVAKIESQDDVQVSTLQRIVQALGGTLEIVARLPSGVYRVGQFTGT